MEMMNNTVVATENNTVVEENTMNEMNAPVVETAEETTETVATETVEVTEQVTEEVTEQVTEEKKPAKKKMTDAEKEKARKAKEKEREKVKAEKAKAKEQERLAKEKAKAEAEKQKAKEAAELAKKQAELYKQAQKEGAAQAVVAIKANADRKRVHAVKWTAQSVLDETNKGNILFNHPLQRAGGQWSLENKSALIDSIMNFGYVPEILALVDGDKRYVIDGRQRLETTVLSFMRDEWALSKDAENVTIIDAEGNEDEINVEGRKFSELEPVLQAIIRKHTFTVQLFENYSEAEVQDLMARINSGKAMTKTQLTRCSLGISLATKCNEIIQKGFFTDTLALSNAQRTNEVPLTMVLQCLLVRDHDQGNYDMKDFTQGSLLKYGEWLKDNGADKKIAEMSAVIDFLTNAFPLVNKEIIPDEDKLKATIKLYKTLKPVRIPFVIAIAHEAMDDGMTSQQFSNFYAWFEKNHGDQYRNWTCGGGTTRKDSVERRYDDLMKLYLEYREMLENMESEVAEAMEEHEAEIDTDEIEVSLDGIENTEDFQALVDACVPSVA